MSKADISKKIICRVCGEEIKDEPDTVYCISCRTPHHPECWEYAGQCAVYGCSKTKLRLTTLEWVENKMETTICFAVITSMAASVILAGIKNGGTIGWHMVGMAFLLLLTFTAMYAAERSLWKDLGDNESRTGQLWFGSARRNYREWPN